MALAILEELGIQDAGFRFRIDTGTNRYYQLKIGSHIQRKHGLNWVSDVYFTTPVRVNESGGDLFNSAQEVSIPATRFDKGNAYVQLFSYKTPQGKSPAFSNVIRVHQGIGFPISIPDDLGSSYSLSTPMNGIPSFHPPRAIACRTYQQTYAQQASLDEILGGLLRVAGPMVLQLLGGSPSGAQAGASTGQSPAGGSAGGNDLLATLLRTLLGSLSGAGGQATSQQASLISSDAGANRFLAGRESQLSQPFFWAALLPVIQAVAGELVKVAPQLMNSANQRRVQMKQADNQLVTDALTQVNQRILLERLLEAQRQGAPGSQSVDVNQLIQLLQQPSPPAAGEPAPAAAPPATGQSLSLNGSYASTLSRTAVVSFETAQAVAWNGVPKNLFIRGLAVVFTIQLNVTEPAPKSPLPKAIVKITFKDPANQAVLGEKVFKQKNVLANSPIPLSFLADELTHLPANKPLHVFAEFRWLNARTGKEYEALGATEIVLVNRYFLGDMSAADSEERELVDMHRFRPFWNKIWESPALDAATQRDGLQKTLWELDANAKYTVLLTADSAANGLMNTKILRVPPETESLTETTQGKLKAGIELSITELNKLLPLWDGVSALEAEKLEAFTTGEFARNNASECVHRLRLKGRAAERGLVWVVPVFKLFDFNLATVQKTGEGGQVLEVASEPARFPVPVAVRVIGLKSSQAEPVEDEPASSESADPGYSFAGFAVEFSEKIMLLPAVKKPGQEIRESVAV